MSDTMEIFVEVDGTVSFIYSDKLASLARRLGDVRTQRASHVEPTSDSKWTADMSPIEPGVVLGPFDTKDEALGAEVSWLLARLANGPIEVIA
jgi:hypothetical protein